MNLILKLNKIMLLLILIILPISVFAVGKPFTNMYVFGDSLSDNGNLASLPQYSFLNSPPFEHAFTNGPVAVEVLATYLGLKANPSLHLVGAPQGTNYAVAGATAGDTGDVNINLSSQVDVFLGYQPNYLAPEDALYIIFIGGNDLRDALSKPGKPVIKNAVQAIDFNIRKLITAGAGSIMVVNVGNLGLAPAISALGKNVVKKASLLTKQFNSNLSSHLIKIEKDFNVDIIEFDLFQLSNFVATNSVGLGYINSTEACYNTAELKYYTRCDSGANFEDFVYFDSLHPTKATHERMGSAFYSLVPKLP